MTSVRVTTVCLVPLACSFWWRQLPCCDLHHGEVLMARNWVQSLANNQWETESLTGTKILSPTACEEHSPASNPLSELGSRFFSIESSDETAAPVDTVTETLWETLVLDPQKLWGNKSCFEPWSLGIICYAAVDKSFEGQSWLTSFGGFSKALQASCLNLA